MQSFKNYVLSNGHDVVGKFGKELGGLRKQELSLTESNKVAIELTS